MKVLSLHIKRLTYALLLSMGGVVHGQGLLDLLNEDVEEPTIPVAATFKDTRIVNVQSNEMAEGVLHFVIAHRFWHPQFRSVRVVGA